MRAGVWDLIPMPVRPEVLRDAIVKAAQEVIAEKANPFAETVNPFEGGYKNPFEGAGVNPFQQ